MFIVDSSLIDTNRRFDRFHSESSQPMDGFFGFGTWELVLIIAAPIALTCFILMLFFTLRHQRQSRHNRRVVDGEHNMDSADVPILGESPSNRNSVKLWPSIILLFSYNQELNISLMGSTKMHTKIMALFETIIELSNE